MKDDVITLPGKDMIDGTNTERASLSQPISRSGLAINMQCVDVAGLLGWAKRSAEHWAYDTGLSFPMSLLWALRKMVECKTISSAELLRVPHLRIITAGCSHRLEQRILQESNYFQELTSYLRFSSIELCMVGPEMEAPQQHLGSFGGAGRAEKSHTVDEGRPPHDLHWVAESDAFKWSTFQGTLLTFLKARCDMFLPLQLVPDQHLCCPWWHPCAT
jgi:hypothetical protein